MKDCIKVPTAWRTKSRFVPTVGRIFDVEILRKCLFALAFLGLSAVAGEGTAMTLDRGAAKDLLTLYRKLKPREFADGALSRGVFESKKVCSELCRLNIRGGWNDDSDEHVISLTGVEDRRTNNRVNVVSTPPPLQPSSQGLFQDAVDKVLRSFW